MKHYFSHRLETSGLPGRQWNLLWIPASQPVSAKANCGQDAGGWCQSPQGKLLSSTFPGGAHAMTLYESTRKETNKLLSLWWCWTRLVAQCSIVYFLLPCSGWPCHSIQRVEGAASHRGPAGWNKTDFLPVNWHVLVLFFYFVCESRSVVSDSLRPHGLYSPWNSLGQNTGVGSLSLLHGIFPTQGSNPGLLQVNSSTAESQGKPRHVLITSS